MRARAMTAWVIAGQLIAADVHASPFVRASAITTTGAEAEAAAADRVVRAELAIDVALGDASAIIADRVRVRGEALLRRREILPARDDSDPRIAIRIEPLATGPGYRCRYSVQHQGAAVEGTEAVSDCPVCTEGELLEQVEAAIERVAARVPDVARQSTPAPAPAITPDVDDSSQRRAPLGALGKAGIGVSVLGALGVVAGAVVATRPPKRGDGVEGDETQYDKPGIAVLAVGCGVLVAGLVMIAVDRRRAKKSPSGAAFRGAPLRF